MQRINQFVLIAIISTLLFSCQKEVDFQDGSGGGATTEIIGNYSFVSMTANTKATIVTGTGPLQEKAISTSAYTTTNNVGTVNITATNFITTGIGYSIAGIAATEYYVAGILVTSMDLPFDFDLPPTDGNSTYRRINNDSIYFDNGFISYDPNGTGTPTATLPIGARISWRGDTLLMKTVFSQTSTQDIGGGIMAQVTSAGDQLIKMKKL